MSRKTIVAALAGALLLGGLGAPALADPLPGGEEETRACVRTDSTSGKRDGICVAVPVGR